MEEPFANPPQQEKKTEIAEMSGIEESDLHSMMSARVKNILPSKNADINLNISEENQKSLKQKLLRNYQTQ